MKRDPIIFDPKVGCLYAEFSFRHWVGGLILALSLPCWNLADRLCLLNLTSDELADLEDLYETTPLMRLLWDLGDWFFAIGYPLSGEEILDALNEAIPYEHLTEEMQAVADDWNNRVTLLLPDRMEGASK